MVYSVTYILCYGVFRVTMRCAVGTKAALPQGTSNHLGRSPSRTSCDPVVDWAQNRMLFRPYLHLLATPLLLPEGIQSEQSRSKSKRCRPNATRPGETFLQMIRRLACRNAAPLCLLAYSGYLIFAQAVLRLLSGGGGGCRASDEDLNGLIGRYKRVGGTGSGRCGQGTVF